MSHWQVRIWRWIAGLFALLVILFAALAGLFRLASPLVPGYRQQVEQWASAAIQHPVQIHSMSADLGWYGPEVELLDVRILSRDKTRTVVAAREVHLGVSLWSLLHGSMPRPDRIVLVGVASAHRGEAFEACEFIMDYLKTRAPFWKKELRADGQARWVAARECDREAVRRWEEVLPSRG